MQIKKYIADNYSSALARIKQEMGNDALILTTRSIREKSDWDGRSASKVEITAAIDSSATNVKNETKVKVSETNFKLPDFDEEFEPDVKLLLYSLFSQTERAQSLGLKSHQLELFSHLAANGVNEKIIAKIPDPMPNFLDKFFLYIQCNLFLLINFFHFQLNPWH